MTIKSLSLCAIIGVVITGLMIFLILLLPDEFETFQLNDQNQLSVPESDATSSFSKGTILLLLAVGVIGVLGVGRKKKSTESDAQNNETPHATGVHNLNEDKQKIIA